MRMLLELAIRNFAVIEETRITFAPGLNALTGETGAGKSIVIDALGAILGARTSAEFVRTGTPGAYVEAVFDIGALPDAQRLRDTLAALGVAPEPDEPLVLARDIAATGRSTARIGGRTVTASVLGQIGQLLVDIHGQSDHLSLLRPAAQLDLLDRFAGTQPLRDEVAEAFTHWQQLRRRVRDFDEEQRARAQRLDLLRFQSEELGLAAPLPDEDVTLARERAVLANAERLIRSAAEAQAALSGDTSASMLDTGALDRLRSAVRALEEIAQHDPGIETVLTRLRDALFAAEDVAAEVRDYAERIELDPARLAEIDERLELLRRLKRKYGPELADVIAHAASIQQEMERLEVGDQDIDALRGAAQQARAILVDRACLLSQRRQAAALTLAERVERAIAELNMGRASFEVRFGTQADPHGVPVGGERIAIDATGFDRVAFFLAANAGEELRPLARVASGGETARLMLALKSILSDVDDTPILVFDEVDVGVGGRSGQVVGEKLWSLTDRHQTIVISHLPQIAAFADRHLVLVKTEHAGRTTTTAQPVEGAARIDELAAMLDGQPPTAESRLNATALLERIDAWKRQALSPASGGRRSATGKPTGR
jgi:DNA repair protein RecN (Recombination protein N)